MCACGWRAGRKHLKGSVGKFWLNVFCVSGASWFVVLERVSAGATVSSADKRRASVSLDVHDGVSLGYQVSKFINWLKGILLGCRYCGLTWLLEGYVSRTLDLDWRRLLWNLFWSRFVWKNLDGISGCHILGLNKARKKCLILPMVSWEHYPKRREGKRR